MRPGFKRFRPVGFFGLPYACMRLALVYRLLPVWAVALLGAAFAIPPARAQEASIEPPVEVLVPLRGIIYYILPGPQPSVRVEPGSKVTLAVTDVLLPETTVLWYRNGELIEEQGDAQFDLGVVVAQDAAYYLAQPMHPSARYAAKAIDLKVLPPGAEGGSRIENCSLRGTITPENPRLIGGVVVGPQKGFAILVRAVGPSLAVHGVAAPLPDPVLRFFDAAGNPADGYILGVTVAVVGAPTIEELVEAAGQNVGAFPLPRGAGDVAYLVAFPPGAYTAHVTSASGASGDILLEFYDVLETPEVAAALP